MFSEVPLKTSDLINLKVFCDVNSEFQQSNCNLKSVIKSNLIGKNLQTAPKIHTEAFLSAFKNISAFP